MTKAEPDYVELHCHSTFSLLDGASHPEELVKQAQALGMDTLALTDHDNLYGAVRFVTAARAHGVRPILGAELSLADGTHLTLLVEDDAGWRNLCALVSIAQHEAPKGAAQLPVETLAEHTAGLVALSGCKHGAVAAAMRRGDRQAARTAAHKLRALFGRERCWIELQHHLLPQDDWLVAKLVTLADEVGLPYVATNNVHYAKRNRRMLQDVLVCIRQHTTLDAASGLLRPNSEFYLKRGAKLAPLFAAYPRALRNSRLIADRCHFELRYGLQDLPRFPTPAGMDAAAYLGQLCTAALPKRYSHVIAKAETQLSYELAVIARAELANYFLIVWDLVRFAREQGIRCQGRGSAANSLVAYLLGISPIDPIAHDLVFERFLSDERAVLPDIDIDFAADRREEVIQYTYRRYGADHAAMACTLVTFRGRSAARDIGKVLGLPATIVAQLEAGAEHAPAAELQPGGGVEQHLSALLPELCQAIHGVPRHLGIHNGGMILTGTPIADRLPTEPATMPDRVVVQWDKDALEEAGLVKIDILGLRMLSALSEAEAIVRETAAGDFDLERLTFDDPEVYALIARGDTVGLFQVESRAQAQLQPRLQPRCFADLIVAISLIRPGPLQGEMVHPYLRRRAGLEPITYAHPALRPALEETLGVILFQEQVLKVARDVAGFTPGQGEQLRRALGSKHAAAALADLRELFLHGAARRGIEHPIAAAIFGQLTAFAGYSFPKSHAAAFAVLVYQSAVLKRYYPAAFFAALLNNQPMGFWAPAQLVADAQRHGVRVLSVDIERSRDRCRVRGGAIRLGLRYIDGCGPESIGRIERARHRRSFTDLRDFCQRTRLPRRLVEQLILGGAMDRWQIPRRSLLWQLGQLHYQEDELDLVFALDNVQLPPLTRMEALAVEERILGFSLDDHPLALFRPVLRTQGIRSSREVATCAEGERIRVAGRVVIHQSPPTAKGHHFLTLEDEHELLNIIMRPDVVERFRVLLHTGMLLVVTGTVQRHSGVINIIAERVVDMRTLLDRQRSREQA